MKAGIWGVSGYSGMVLYQLLKQHPQVSEVVLFGSGAQAQSLGEVIPAFGDSDEPILPLIWDESAVKIIADLDCLFYATPSGVTGQVMDAVIAAKLPVIDLSGDFRLTDSAQYETWYHQKNRQLPPKGTVTYGLAEFTEQYQPYIANPGCYATATLLGLAPLAQAGWLQADSIVIDAKSGVSGAGKNPNAHSHFPFINENAWVYRLNEHQHIPEIVQQL